MALIDFQTALGRLVRVQSADDPLRGLDLDTNERSCIEAVTKSSGFQFTVSVQRSWCIGRAAKAASLTLSLIGEDRRRRLLEDWIDTGAGTESFYGVEAELFFDFIRTRFTDASHERTICQFEQAVLRASTGSNGFAAPDLLWLDHSECVLRRGRYAGLLPFHAEPSLLLDAVMKQRALPPFSPVVMTMLFCPGLEQLCRAASIEEVNLWDRLETPVGVKILIKEGHRRETIEDFLWIGALEFRIEPTLNSIGTTFCTFS